MSQTWHIPLLTTDTLSDSRGYINDALAALRSSFSGTSSPSSPVAGQLFLDTDDNLLYVYNGASWFVVGDADLNYLGSLPRQGGASYAMGGDLYMGTHQIKGVTDPTLSTDAVSKNYGDTTYLAKAGGTMAGNIVMGANNLTIDHNPTDATHAVRKAYADLFLPLAGGTMTGPVAMGGYAISGLPAAGSASAPIIKSTFDAAMDVSGGHRHRTSENSRPVFWGDLSTTGDTVGDMLQADGSGGLLKVGFHYGSDFGAGTALSTTYATAETASVVIPAGSNVTAHIRCIACVSCNVQATANPAYAWDLRLRRNTTQIFEKLDVHCHVAEIAVADLAGGTFIVFEYDDRPGAGTYDYDFQLRFGISGMAASSMSCRKISVLVNAY